MRRLLNRLFGWRYVIVDVCDGRSAHSRIQRAYQGECGWMVYQTVWVDGLFPARDVVTLRADYSTSREDVQWAPWIGWGKQVPAPAPDEFVEWRLR